MPNKVNQQSGDELEVSSYGEDELEVSFYSKVNCLDFGRVPLKDFTVEDLRLMIGQKIGLQYLVPLALGHLEHDPLVSGKYYAGDLLESIQCLPAEFWEQHPDLQKRWQKIQVTVTELPTV